MEIREAYRNNTLHTLNEVTAKELVQKAQPRVKARVKAHYLRSYFVGVDASGTLLFRTTSGTTPGKFWLQYIRMLDLKDAQEIRKTDKKIRDIDLVNLCVFGNISVYCNDPSFKWWGWQYIAWKRGYGLRKQERFPKVRNPALQGSVCKHLLSVFAVLPFNIPAITKALKQKKLL